MSKYHVIYRSLFHSNCLGFDLPKENRTRYRYLRYSVWQTIKIPDAYDIFKTTCIFILKEEKLIGMETR